MSQARPRYFLWNAFFMSPILRPRPKQLCFSRATREGISRSSTLVSQASGVCSCGWTGVFFRVYIPILAGYGGERGRHGHRPAFFFCVLLSVRLFSKCILYNAELRRFIIISGYQLADFRWGVKYRHIY